MMDSFRFHAATIGNEKRDGVIDAATLDEAVAALQARGLYVIRVDQRSRRIASFWNLLNREFTLRPPINSAALATLSQEWAGMLEAGIAVDESLALLSQGTRPGIQTLLSGVRNAVKSGLPLHTVLTRYPDSFPPVFSALVQAGEKASTLPSTLRRLGDDLMTRRMLAEEVRNALIYPLFLVVTATMGILVLLLVVVPSLESMTGEGGVDRLPAMTRLVLASSHMLRDHGIALACTGLVSLIAAISSAMTTTGRRWVDGIVMKSPLIGPLVRTIETARYARTFGGLLAGGVAAPTAMRVALDTVMNRRMRLHLEEAHRSIIAGATIADAIAMSGVFAADAIGLIRVGERTGRLADTLDRIAALNGTRAARQLKALTAMLTPLLTIGFGLVTGVIVYAMLSTILSINELAAP